MITIARTTCAFENEPFAAPFGFKGGYVNGLWQVVAFLVSENGNEGLGVGVQSPLWSDAGVFSANPEPAGNAMMFLMTAHALKLAQGQSFETPLDLLDRLLPAVHEFDSWGQSTYSSIQLFPTSLACERSPDLFSWSRPLENVPIGHLKVYHPEA